MKATTSRPPSLFVLLLLLLGACRPDAPAPDPRDGRSASVFNDPRVLAIDYASPFTTFDGAFGSVLLGQGWAGYEKTVDHQSFFTDKVHDFAWALDGMARIYVELPRARRIDFFAEVTPYGHRHSGPQELVLEAGERVLGRQELSDGWHQVRIPLPEDSFRSRWANLRLSFRYAITPKEVDGTADERRLSAAFRRIALVPREIEDAAAFLDATRLDPASGRLRLADGAGVALPLPASSEITLDLARLAADLGDSCRLDAGLETPAGELTAIWNGEAAAARRKGTVRATTPPSGLARLALTLSGCAGGEIPFDAAAVGIRRLPRPPAAKPHVFLYLVDTLRADSLTVYGAQRPTSPRLEELARDAVTYLDAWSPSAWTLPAIVSVLTGVYPDRHQVSLGRVRLDGDGFPTLAARLGAAGYHTLAVSQSFIASRKFGVHHGFDEFFLSDQLSSAELRSQEARSYLLRSLLANWDGTSPIFAYVHTVEPHAPYAPPGAFASFANEHPGRLPVEHYDPLAFMDAGHTGNRAEVAHMRARYDGEVAFADRQLGRFVDLLRHLGLYDDSVIIVVSDHGEEFGEHGGFGHGRMVYEEMLRVPLVVKYPRSLGAGSRIEEKVSTVDLLPTIQQLAGIGGEGEAFDGRILPPLGSENGAAAPRRFTFSEVKALPVGNLAAVHYRAFRLDDVKCIENVAGIDQFEQPAASWQVFDLAEDPLEQHPLEETDPRFRRCRETLQRWLATRSQYQLDDPASLRDTDPSILERLRALGYVD